MLTRQRRAAAVAGWVGGLAAAGVVAMAGEAPRTPVARVALDLLDGSRVVGTAAVETIRFRTPYARIDAPLRLMRSVRMAADRENAVVDMAGGDRFTGAIELRSVTLDAAFGRLTVGIEFIAALRVATPGGASWLSEPEESLALYYPFDEGAGGRRDTGEKGGPWKAQGARWTPDGKSGGAYEFDGRRDFITTPVVDSTGDMTWSVWIYPRSFPSVHDTYQQFLGARGRAWAWNSDNTSLSYSFQNHHGGSRLALQFVVQGDERTGWGLVYVFPAIPEANRWYHVAGVLDGKGMRLYLDGRRLAENSEPARLAAPCPLIIGANDNGPQRYFDGRIDEVMVLKKALSADDIRSLYESQR